MKGEEGTGEVRGGERRRKVRGEEGSGRVRGEEGRDKRMERGCERKNRKEKGG